MHPKPGECPGGCADGRLADKGDENDDPKPVAAASAAVVAATSVVISEKSVSEKSAFAAACA